MTPAFPAESRAMRVVRAMGFESLAWSLRRLHCPVNREALVLEVGSGGNPYCRANVLLDAYEETRERHWAPLVADRPTVLGLVENLPFRDKAFDFVIASHVLEHSSDPSRFLAELERVARAGYIESPDAFMERVNPYRDHRLEITVRDGRLLIRKKKWWQVDQELVELYEERAKRIITRETIPRRPFAFHVRYYWSGGINYQIVNPEEDAGWESPASAVGERQSRGLKRALHDRILSILRRVLSQRARNRQLKLLGLLACPACRSGGLTETGTSIECLACSSSYEVRRGIPIMNHRARPQACRLGRASATAV